MSAINQGGALEFAPKSVLVGGVPGEALGGRRKRALDVTLAVIVLLALSPLLLMVAAALRFGSGGPVLYGHARIGFGGRPFRCWKFRTMVPDGDAVLARHLASDPEARQEWESTRKLKNDPRVTRLGRVLREYSVDELPQLFNVVLGEMSLVGPRPVVRDELRQYGETARHYVATRPGITGLWQVSGRSDVGYDQRVELDARYVTNWSLGGDIVILARTIPAVVSADGSY